MLKIIIYNLDAEKDQANLLSPAIPNIGDYVVYEYADDGEITGQVKMRDFVFKDNTLSHIHLTINEG